jgi:3-dehydroquinate synthase
MERLNVALAERSYPILIGTGILHDAALYAPALRDGPVVVITDTNVARLCLKPLLDALAAHAPAVLTVPAGEASKTLATVEHLVGELLIRQCDRNTTLVALGGGVIGDLVGFTAACYQRGVDFIQVPTTVLAQVDSAVGGKTAVNHPRGKNMIGAFHQPRAVVADAATLRTLPRREVAAGVAEIIKYGLIADAEFHAWLEEHLAALLSLEAQAVTYAVAHSCRIKAAIVARDEREAGERALLNLGHTFAHAFETALGYGVWLHGEAVGLGMVLAARLAVALGMAPADTASRTHSLVGAAGLPLHLPHPLDPNELLALMATDKKAQRGRLRLVLPERIGMARVVADVDPAALTAVLASAQP